MSEAELGNEVQSTLSGFTRIGSMIETGIKHPITDTRKFMNADSEQPEGQISAGDYLRTLPQYLYPQRLISAATHRLTRIRIPWFKNLLIRFFIKQFKVEMNEAADPDPRSYPDFNQFFTRALQPDARPLAPDQSMLCCPVDGTVSQIGTIDDDTLFQAKGRTFSLTRLLGGDSDCAESFRDGHFATLYLSPRDYHRIHMPIKGTLQEMVHIPGRLFSVSPLTTRVVPKLFARNERVVALFSTELGPMAMILVGAINVSSIATVWAGTITPPYAQSIRCWRYPENGADTVVLKKGAEMGRFNMGSTVILLFARGAVSWNPAVSAGLGVRLGQALARFQP